MRVLFSIALTAGLLLTSVAADAAEAGVSELIQALGSQNEPARLQAIDRLGLAGEAAAEAVPALVELLKDESAPVRAHACQALGEIGAPAKPAVQALARLIGDPDRHVRRAALHAIGDIRPGPEVCIPLFVRVMEDPDPSVKTRALHAMAEEGEQAVPFLVKALGSEEAAYWACLVLGEIGPDAKAAVPALIETLRDQRPGVRREAILALAAIKEAASPAVPALAKALDDPINQVPATYALGNVGPVPEPVEAKIENNVNSSDAVLSTVSVWALARLHPENKALQRRAVELLAERLKSDDLQHRAAAARALLDLDPDPEIARPIIKRVMDGAEPEVVEAAMEAVASLGEKALPRMIEALKVEEVRARAAAIIARIGPQAKAAVPALVDALNDPDPETRSEVLFALAAIGPGAEAAVPAIVKALHDPETDVCYAACYALGRIGGAAMSAKPELQKNLESSDPFLSMASAWALACIHPECKETAVKSVPVLVKALGEPDAITRLHAAESLRALGPCAKDAVPALKDALQDQNADVRQAASQALRAISG